ncbi:MAG: YiiD C-terminal domain-containing protein [Bacteriovoracaceae bacterium]
MDKKELLQFLNREIPLTQSLGLDIVRIDDKGAFIRAPLGPNHNHMGSAFGGSLSTMMILSGYIWLYDALLKHNLQAHVILSKEEAEYLLPVTADIEVLAKSPSNEEWKKFEESFLRKALGRIVIHSEIVSKTGALAARFTGEFVARKA